MTTKNTNPNKTTPDLTNDRADLQTVIDFVRQHEERHKQRTERRAARRRRSQARQSHLDDQRLREAIQVIKWCVVGICSVMVIALVIGVWALIQVEQAVADVEHDVEQVTSRVENILHEVEHPFEGAGRMLGRDLDKSVGEFFGLRRPDSGEN